MIVIYSIYYPTIQKRIITNEGKGQYTLHLMLTVGDNEHGYGDVIGGRRNVKKP